MALLWIGQCVDAEYMHDGSTHAPLPMLDAPSWRYSEDQLHAKACIVCARVDGDLLPAGHVRIETWPGEHLVWAVVACPEHMVAPC